MEALEISGAILAIVIILGLLYLFFIAYTIYHLFTRRGTVNIIVWLIIILIVPLIGSIIYWVMYNTASRRRRI